jgi:neuropeptide FF receptor 1/neuropeptide FF receptor 2
MMKNLRNNSSNLSEEAEREEDDSYQLGGFQAVTDVPLLTIGLLSFLTNLFVITTILRRRNLRTTSNIILVSLGISDLLTGLVCMPLQVTCSVLLNKGLCVATTIFTKFISISTIVHISIITVDWHIFIIHALRYHSLVRKRYVLAVLFTAWLVNSGIALLRLLWALDINITEDEEDEEHNRVKETTYNLVCLGIFCILLFTNIALDTNMLVVLEKQVNKIIKHNLTRDCLVHENRMRSNQRRAVIMCVSMLIINVILWLPYFTYDLWQDQGEWVLTLAGEYVILCVRVLSSLLNPIIYTIGQRTLRKVILKKLRLVFRCKQSQECKTEEVPLNDITRN